MRLVFLILGLLCVGIGLVGMAVPILPTTPFLLLAALCFARSSARLHAWLLGHRTFGPLIRDWQAEGAIGPGAKTMALASMALAIAITVALALPLHVLLIQALVLASAAAFILSRPAPTRRDRGAGNPANP
ncbi:DUF454 domain-containing protein [Pelagibacterium lacus]|uniref:DUF454 domain-containing protein n=1 Tax=Pelagibacterium lacus TaxID=2282655 RepID=A0A369W703_9HYPH|nr:DUF454 domain-containing protein [Pelagibacterium lacus]